MVKRIATGEFLKVLLEIQATDRLRVKQPYIVLFYNFKDKQQ